MSKLLLVALIASCSLVYSIKVNAQLSLGTIENGPYGRGSSVSAPIIVPPAACFAANNVFELWISDASGNFTPGERIGSVSGTYSTYINGTIPGGLAPGNYKLRVKTTNPVSSTDYSGTINIANAVGPFIGVTPTSQAQVLAPAATYGWCGSAVGDNKSMTLNDNSAPNTQSLSLKDEKTGAITNYLPLNGFFMLSNLSQSYYTITITGQTIISGNPVKSTRSYLLLNVLSKISIQSEGSPYGCINPVTGQGAPISYKINTAGLSGIQDNYPGSSYRITWGDNTTDIITHCDLVSRGGIVTHEYQETSCNQPPIDVGNGNVIENSYNVSATSINPFCQSAQATASIYPKIYSKPIARIDPLTATAACINTPIVFGNSTTRGYNSDCTLTTEYEWYVDGVLVSTSETYTHPGFSTPGIHKIRLFAKSDTELCGSTEDPRDICIQAPPQLSFNFNGSQNTTGCAPAVIKPTNTSIIDDNCNTSNIYNWRVTGGPFTFVNGTNAASKEPEFSFNNPGVYQVVLSMTTVSCGVFSTPAQTIVINSPPVATLSANTELCNIGTYNFNNTSGPTYTNLTGTQQALSDTYTWTVTGGLFTFTDGTNANSRYPNINFTEYKTYTITVTHKNSCGTVSDTQDIKFTASPVINAGPDQSICFADQAQLNAAITSGTVNSQVWVGGAGGFNPDRNALNAIYTPTPAERTSGNVNLTLRTTTSLAAPCNVIEDYLIITIKPRILVTSVPTASICTNTALNYAITSNLSTTTYSWTATGSANASGFAPLGSGNTIADQIVNSGPVNNATVTYVITPANDGCNGDPFTLTVTVTPKPLITATPANNPICNRQSSAITLTSNLGNTRYTWTGTASAGITGNSSGIIPAAVTAINDVLVNSGTTAGTVTYVITPVSANDCTGAPVTVIITVAPAVTTSNAGPDQLLCNSGTAALAGNNPGLNTGVWTQLSGTPAVNFTDANDPATTISGLVAGQTYVFRWTISGTSPCPPSQDELTVSNLAPIQNNSISSTDVSVCNGKTITVTGSLPLNGNNVYSYVWESSNDNGNSWVVIAGKTDKDLSYVLTETLSFRRTVNSGSCSSISNTIKINAQSPIVNNVISIDQTICTGNTPAPLTGTLPTGGDGNYNYQWQSSTDNGATWANINGQVFGGLTLPALTDTTSYRRLVSSALCAGSLQNISNTVTITVNPNARAEFTFTANNGCTPFVLNAQNIVAVPYPDRNLSYTWYANDVVIGTDIVFPGYTISTGNTAVEIKLEVTSRLGCITASHTEIFTSKDQITASYTQNIDKGCGNTTVTFTNTTPPLAGAAYLWDFGNGNQSTSANPGAQQFLPQANARDTTYYITLRVTTDCGSSTTAPTSVLVKALPIPIFSPDKTVGCSPLTVKFTNTSKGSATEYFFEFDDGSAPARRTDTSSVQHTFVTGVTREYKVRMTAVNECGSVESTTYTIRVSPNTINAQLVVNGNELQGCAPLTVNFHNNTTGASTSFYDFDDGTISPPSNSFPQTQPYTFTRGGTYVVKLIATNGCSADTARVTITVYNQPDVRFTAEQTSGCPGLSVQFRNQTVGAASFSWDFGDGSAPSTDREPIHIYTGNQEYYTVKLTAINGLGCPNEATAVQFIHITAPPLARFNVLPGTQISIPNYTFRFEDESENTPDRWEWDFGDGNISALKNPAHTYADTGSYRVTLKVTNPQNCFSNTFKIVRITGVPGQLYVPNSFIPGSEVPELREFRAKGSGILSWRMSIFDKWGEQIWETTKLDESRPAEGWDGTFKGSAMPQGLYFWKIDVQFINGTAWKGMAYDKSAPKRTGAIHLIR